MQTNSSALDSTSNTHFASGGTSKTPVPRGGGSSQIQSSIPTKTTRPKELLRHDISDEELVMLANGKRDGISEALWAFFGGAIGSVCPVVRNIYSAYISDAPVALSIPDLFEIIIFSCSIVLVIGCRVILSRKGKTADDLVNEIRARKKS